MDLLTSSNIIFALGILGTIFTVFNYFRNPQIQSDKNEALLAQKIAWSGEGIDRRFKDMQESFQQLVLQSNNHIHTVDTKVEALSKNVGELGIQVARLSTIIDERIPRKQS